jgi:hypothetical protein
MVRRKVFTRANKATQLVWYYWGLVAAKKIWSSFANNLLILTTEKHNSRLPCSSFNVVLIKFVLEL